MLSIKTGKKITKKTQNKIVLNKRARKTLDRLLADSKANKKYCRTVLYNRGDDEKPPFLI